MAMEIAGTVKTTDPSLSDGKKQALRLDAAGKLMVSSSGGSGASSDQVQGTAADGAAAVGNPVQVAGKDGSGNIQAVSTDTSGKVDVNAFPSGTVTHSSVASAATSTTIIAANANRKGLYITNTDANALLLDLSGGTAAASRFHVRLLTNQSYEMPRGLFTSLVTGIWEADGSGSALVAEIA